MHSNPTVAMQFMKAKTSADFVYFESIAIEYDIFQKKMNDVIHSLPAILSLYFMSIIQ